MCYAYAVMVLLHEIHAVVFTGFKRLSRRTVETRYAILLSALSKYLLLEVGAKSSTAGRCTGIYGAFPGGNCRRLPND